MNYRAHNPMIAAFMGGKVEMVWKVNDVETLAWKGEVAHQWRKEKLGISIGEAILVDQLEFHTSWDWLMPVVEKIEDIRTDIIADVEFCMRGKTSVTVRVDLIDPDGGRTSRPLASVYDRDKMTAVYNAVVEFIKLYNDLRREMGANALHQ